MPALAHAQNTARGTPSRSLRDRLRSAFDGIEVFDSHEHFWDERERTSGPLDFFSLANDYVISDVVSAGLTPEAGKIVRDGKAPAAERWRAFEPFWKFARYTGYGQALRLAFRELFGVSVIDERTVSKISAVLQETNRPGVHERILRKARISACVQDDYWHSVPVQAESARYVLARRFDRFIVPGAPADIQALEKLTDTSITSLNRLERALESNFKQNLTIGMKTVKVGLAYMRELHFTEAQRSDAERAFERLMRGEATTPQDFRRYMNRPLRALEDYMFHCVMRIVDAHRIPVQVHTGIHAGNRNVITNTRPTHLINVFHLYPRIAFDLFHIGYPYQSELSALAKSFPNVHVDLCWAHVISPTVARRALDEYLDTIPVNKIFGFGGDYHYPELSYAHAIIARANIAEVLAGKTEQGACSEEDAYEVGRLLLADNARRFFTTRT
jgi:predicted TIM-barrel fold metal-dependent hydrolase